MAQSKTGEAVCVTTTDAMADRSRMERKKPRILDDDQQVKLRGSSVDAGRKHCERSPSRLNAEVAYHLLNEMRGPRDGQSTKFVET